MIYREEIKDLFSISDQYYLAHCISSDFGMGKGIVIEFNNRFNMKRKLKSKYPNYLKEYSEENRCGDCILEGRVLNLITKERYYQKPTYKSLTQALNVMKQVCLENKINKVAMPTIGCGLDKLEWDKVVEIIKGTFNDTEMEILVCTLK